MSEITDLIRRDVEDDVSLKPHAFIVEIGKRKLFAKQQPLRVAGTVSTQHELERIRSIVNHHTGDAYRIEFEIQVQEHADA